MNDFSVEADSVEKVDTVVHGIIMGVEMPFPLPNPNGCVDSGLECPLEKGKNYAYVATLPVLKSYPKVKMKVRFPLIFLKFLFFSNHRSESPSSGN